MTDHQAPERIWVCLQYQGKAFHDFTFGGWPEYVSATALEAAQARIDELEAALDHSEREFGVSNNGNAWRFWSKKSLEVVQGKAEAIATARAEALEEAKKAVFKRLFRPSGSASEIERNFDHNEDVMDAMKAIDALKGGSNG